MYKNTDRIPNPPKQVKRRLPGVERDLSSWAQNHQKQGFCLPDAMIRESAHLSATNCAEGKEKDLSTRWLKKFKHKHKTAEQPQPQSSKVTTPQDSLSPSVLRSLTVDHNYTTNPTDTIMCDGTNLGTILNPGSYLRSVASSPICPSGTPTLDEARRALQLILNYFQHQTMGLCPQEYAIIGKMIERLDLVKNQIDPLPGTQAAW